MEPLTHLEFAYAVSQIIGRTDKRVMLDKIKQYKKVYDSMEVLKNV